MLRILKVFTVIVATAVVLLVSTANTPADEPQEKPPAAVPKAPEKPADPYAVPEGDADVLFKFIDRLKQIQPTSRREALSHYTKAPPAIKTAAEKIMALEKDKKSKKYQRAAKEHLEARIGSVYQADDDEKKKLVGDVRAFSSKALTGGKLNLAFPLELAQVLQMMNETELASQVYKDHIEILKKMDSKELADVIKMMEARVRLATLIGSEMKIEGTTVTGKKFDWASYRGKVVLVDFWATWCGPCLAEIPNIRANYEKYHDKGFEVVGINLDDDREDVNRFLEGNKLPWTTLHQNDGKPNVTAVYYGVNGIPEVILIGKDGKVLARHVHGQRLGEMLKDLLGVKAPPKEKKKAADQSS